MKKNLWVQKIPENEKKSSKTTLDADQTFVHESKGHLISEIHFGVLNFPKNNNEKIWQISDQEFKKWPNQ